MRVRVLFNNMYIALHINIPNLYPMKSDNIVKWSFIAIILGIVVITAAMFLVSDEQKKEASEKAAKTTEKMRL